MSATRAKAKARKAARAKARQEVGTVVAFPFGGKWGKGSKGKGKKGGRKGKRGGKKGGGKKGGGKLGKGTCRMCHEQGHWGNECPTLVNQVSAQQGQQQAGRGQFGGNGSLNITYLNSGQDGKRTSSSTASTTSALPSSASAAVRQVRMYHVATPPEVYPEQSEVDSQEGEDWWTAKTCMVQDISIASDGEEGTPFPGDALYEWYNGKVENVRAVHWQDPQLIVLDSGADVSLLPQSMSSCGSRSGHSGAILEDAQGGRLNTFGRRLAQVEFQLDDVALIQDDFLVATVQNPLSALAE